MVEAEWRTRPDRYPRRSLANWFAAAASLASLRRRSLTAVRSQRGRQRIDALGSARLIGQDPFMAKPALDLSSLTSDEKLELIDDLWGSLKPEDFELTPAQQAELDRRLERLDREGPVGNSWDDVRAKMSRGTR